MKLKDLIEYCKLKAGKCSDCEYTGACEEYFDGYIEHYYDPLIASYDFMNLDVEIRKDDENDKTNSKK